MGIPESEVRDRISGYELKCWELLENIQPWGQRREDYRMAVLCWVTASVNYGGKGRRPQLKDFMKYFDFEPKEKRDIREIFNRR